LYGKKFSIMVKGKEGWVLNLEEFKGRTNPAPYQVKKNSIKIILNQYFFFVTSYISNPPIIEMSAQ